MIQHQRGASRGTARRGERGASLVEYALLVALIAVVCIVAVTFIGTSGSGKFNGAGGAIDGNTVATTADPHTPYPIEQGPMGTCGVGYNVEMSTQMCIWAG